MSVHSESLSPSMSMSSINRIYCARDSCIDPDFKVTTEVWSISLVRAYGHMIKSPRAILIIDGDEKPKRSANSRHDLRFTLPIMLEFGEQGSSWWKPDNCMNVINRASGKQQPIPISPEDIDVLKSEPNYAQKTWSISRMDALEFLLKVQHREKLHVQFLW